MINNLTNAQKKTITKTNLLNSDASQYYDMIVFCHLRWQFVYQRPQHIISRMAETMKILFVEEPLQNPENISAGNLIAVNKMLHVLQPNVNDIESIASIIPTFVKNKN